MASLSGGVGAGAGAGASAAAAANEIEPPFRKRYNREIRIMKNQSIVMVNSIIPLLGRFKETTDSSSVMSKFDELWETIQETIARIVPFLEKTYRYLGDYKRIIPIAAYNIALTIVGETNIKGPKGRDVYGWALGMLFPASAAQLRASHAIPFEYRAQILRGINFDQHNLSLVAKLKEQPPSVFFAGKKGSFFFPDTPATVITLPQFISILDELITMFIHVRNILRGEFTLEEIDAQLKEDLATNADEKKAANAIKRLHEEEEAERVRVEEAAKPVNTKGSIQGGGRRRSSGTLSRNGRHTTRRRGGRRRGLGLLRSQRRRFHGRGRYYSGGLSP
jgi:hypothetical protein